MAFSPHLKNMVPVRFQDTPHRVPIQFRMMVPSIEHDLRATFVGAGRMFHECPRNKEIYSTAMIISNLQDCHHMNVQFFRQFYCLSNSLTTTASTAVMTSCALCLARLEDAATAPSAALASATLAPARDCSKGGLGILMALRRRLVHNFNNCFGFVQDLLRQC